MNSIARRLCTLAILLLLSACGGDDQAPPPAATTDNDSLPQLQALANDAKGQCCQTFGPYMVNYGTSLAAGNFGAPGALPPSDGCQNAVMNFELQFRTIDNGQYANRPDAQAWRNAQGAGIANCVGGMMQSAGLPIGPTNYGDYAVAMLLIGKEMQNKVPSVGNLTSYVPTAPVNPTLAQAPFSTGSLGLSPMGSNPFAEGTQVMPFLPQIPAGM